MTVDIVELERLLDAADAEAKGDWSWVTLGGCPVEPESGLKVKQFHIDNPSTARHNLSAFLQGENVLRALVDELKKHREEKADREEVEYPTSEMTLSDGEVIPAGIHYDTSKMVARMLDDETMFVNCRSYIPGGWGPDGKWDSEKGPPEGPTIVAFVICNDIFAWGCSDAEHITTSEVPELYRLWKADKMWGSTQWCIKKRGEQPQFPVKRDMIAAGAWLPEFDALKENGYDAYCRAAAEKKREEQEDTGSA